MADAFFTDLAGFVSQIIDLEYSLSQATQRGPLTAVQHKILRILYFSQSPTLSDLSLCAGLSLPNCSREVKKLSGWGLLEKIASAEDRRKTMVQLSPGGVAEVAGSFERMAACFYQRTGVWDEARMSATQAAMATLRKTLLA